MKHKGPCCLLPWKGAAHGFRDLSVISIQVGFEHALTEMKTNFDIFMNT